MSRESSTHDDHIGPIDDIVSWVQASAGIDPATLHPEALPVGIRRRMRSLSVTPSAYAEMLLAAGGEASPGELEALLEELGLGETWFFRDVEPFHLLAQHAEDRRHRPQPLRVLSVPCATGEEPYSVAMTLIEGGFDPANFTIDGIDLRRQALLIAQQGKYRETSFRSMESAARSRYFVTATDHFVLRREVARCVQFHHGNLLDLDRVLRDQQPYDVILCRNVLIYLDGETRSRVAATVLRHLAVDGLLITGHAEMRSWGTQVEPVMPPSSFALRRVDHVGGGSKPGREWASTTSPEPVSTTRHFRSQL